MRFSRRRFLQVGGAFSASSIFFPSIIKAQNLRADKLRVAIIGVGGRGKSHVAALQSEQIVAFCDVDDNRAAATFSKYPNVPRFKDYRVMFDKMGKDFDAVSIAIPDHMHYPVALWAMAQGKHILVEKPLVRTFEEAMLIKQVAKESGLVTQMGNQGHASDGLRAIKEWIGAGLIGDVQETYHWTNRPIWPQGMAGYEPASPVPAGLDWDLWQGVAPEMDYCDGLAPFNWRGFRNYGCGAIGDIACHSMDVAYSALKLGFPTKIAATSSGMTDVAYPKKASIDFEFNKPGSGQLVKVHWLDGGQMPKNVPFVPDEVYHASVDSNGIKNHRIQNGSFLVGSKGTIMCDMYCGKPMIFPEDDFKQLRHDGALPKKSLPRIKGGHFVEWVDCIKQGRQPEANIADYAADFTATALLGSVALSSDQSLDFDSDSLSFVGNEQANLLLKSQYEYRKGFIPA